MADATFHGVNVGWMQAQWRDCADKPTQLKIFRDICGKKATVQQILEVVGEPEYCGPEAPAKRTYERYTKEDEETILRMAAEGATDKAIADALGKSEGSITVKITAMRKKGIEVRRGKKAEEKPLLPVFPRTEEPEKERGLTVDGAMTVIESALNALYQKEKKLCDELNKVHAEMNQYRRRIGDLLAMAGGGLNPAEPRADGKGENEC